MLLIIIQISISLYNTYTYSSTTRFCQYCEEIISTGKLKRHILRKHSDIEEVYLIIYNIFIYI